jgi:alpha-glucuronidase
LEKVAALAKVFRPYGIKVYLTARFSAPVEIGKLKSSDPLLPEVQDWWKAKADEIYALIPDFGGFLVKANSEGQPGPQNYGRNHHDGANMLAKAVGDRGIVMWRAFVYDNNVPDDRARQAYNEFKPLDGSFRNNVFVQVKNGPIDFQPREPFHPLFAAMPKTPLMMEFQITQEYLGCATHLVYLAPMYKEVLDVDTYAHGKGTTVANIIDGSADGHNISGMAGVSNIGNDINWTGHPFAQSNWYAFGRLAWDHGLSSEDIANEWLRMTFTNNPVFLKTAKSIMLQSHETTVSYMTPIGLHHIMAWDHHWGPGPWVNIGRPDWTSLYYHRADTLGIGFNRTTTGSNSVGQYHQPVANTFNDIEKIPEKYLLWFHHVPWSYKMKSGRTLWEEMVFHYYAGAEAVQAMQQQWDSIEGVIDDQRFVQVKQLLAIQYKEAVWWRNACVLYFQQFSRMPIPAGYEQPEHTLEHYQNLKFHFVPGI